MLGVERSRVTLMPFSDEWYTHYQIARDELLKIMGANVVAVHHIGSTAIKGIYAKPILDVAVVIRRVELLGISDMEAAGYEYCGERGVAGRHLFVRRINDNISTHHIHCYLENNENLNHSILFCKFLNKRSDYAKQYNDLKKELADKYPNDRIAYTDGKAFFISHVLEKAKNESYTF